MEIRYLLLAVVSSLFSGMLCAQSFTERDVAIQIVDGYEHDTMLLAGTLTLPIGVRGDVPAVILITGSGAQNRDEELLGHRPFKVTAEHLSSQGYAVLRCDDRGVGGSTGNMAKATTFDFVSDVEQQIGYLQQQKDLGIDPDRIFLFGHSEGAAVAAIVAAKNVHTQHPVAGVMMLGGAAVDGKTLLLQQNEIIFRQRGVSDSLVGRRLTCMRDLFATLDTLSFHEGTDSVKTVNLAFRPLFKKHGEGLTKEQKQMCGLTSGECYGWALTVATPWMRTFLNLNPAEYIAKMRCPLLAIGGEKDCQVPPGNLELIENLCKKYDVPCTIKLMQGVNHLGQECVTGAVDEYAGLGQAPAQDVLNALVQWLDTISKK